MPAPTALETLPSKAWSCSSLLRGQSMMRERFETFELDASMSMEEKLAASCWYSSHKWHACTCTYGVMLQHIYTHPSQACRQRLEVLRQARQAQPEPPAEEPAPSTPAKRVKAEPDNQECEDTYVDDDPYLIEDPNDSISLNVYIYMYTKWAPVCIFFPYWKDSCDASASPKRDLIDALQALENAALCNIPSCAV